MAYEPDTSIGGRSHRFPLTRHSAIHALRDPDPATRSRASSSLIDAYWKPVYKYIRLKWNKPNEDAKDLTQSFFLATLEKNYLDAYDPAKGSFRNFLRVCLDAFLANQNQSAQRLKRGGDSTFIPLDFESADGEIRTLPLASSSDPEAFFHQEWIRHLFASSIEQLRADAEASHRQTQFAIFQAYDLDQSATSYQQLSSTFALPVPTITNHLAAMRRQLRKIVLHRLGLITATEDEFQREARALFGDTRP